MVVVKAFFTGGAQKLLHDKTYNLGKSQDITQRLVHHLIKSSTFTVLVAYCVKQQVEIDVVSGPKFRQFVS